MKKMLSLLLVPIWMPVLGMLPLCWRWLMLALLEVQATDILHLTARQHGRSS